MLISAASSLGEYVEMRRDMFAIQDPSNITVGQVLAVTSVSHPGCYDVAVAMSPAMQEGNDWVLLVHESEIDFRNLVLPGDPLDRIIIGAAIGDVTKRELWDACKTGELSLGMRESLFS